MQIYSSSPNYGQAHRAQSIDRKPAETDASEDIAVSRREDAITGSPTVLSRSLADALWAMQRPQAQEEQPAATNLQDLYRDFAS